MRWRNKHRHAAQRLTHEESAALAQWADQRAARAARRGRDQAPNSDQHHTRVEARSNGETSVLQRTVRENRQLRQQLEAQWSVMYESMLQSTEHGNEMRLLREKNRLLREQNDRLLSNERQAFRCIADNERKTSSYRKRNRALVQRNKDLLCERKQLKEQLSAALRRAQLLQQHQEALQQSADTTSADTDSSFEDTQAVDVDNEAVQTGK